MSARASVRRHVLVLTDTFGDAGAERVAMHLLLAPEAESFRRTVCLTRPPGEEGAPTEANLARVSSAGVEVLRLERRTRADVWSWRALAMFLRSQRVDLLHAHKFGSNVWGSVLGRATAVPAVVAHEHTWSFEGQPLRRLIDRNVVGRLADVVIAVSEADRRRMIELVGMPAQRVVLIPNGVPPRDVADAGHVRAELDIPPDAPILVLTAVLRAQKAITVMLEAMAVLNRAYPTLRLLLVGPGEQEQPLRVLAADLGINEVVHFLGHRDDVGAILAASTIGVLSSDFEGSPLAVLEYMAAGLPVVATDVGGVPQQVQDGRTGLLVPRRDPAALAAAIARLLDAPLLAAAMGERGRSRQRELYSMDAMSRRVYALYEELLANPARGQRSR